MSGDTFRQAFPDNGGSIVNTFFASTDLTEKTWASVRLLAEADDVTFWTVIANHQKAGAALTSAITAADVSHSSSSAAQRKAVKREDEKCLCTIIIRLATTSQYCTGERSVSVSDFARRLEAILPLGTLFPTATMLFRKSGATASVVLTSLFLLNPGYLCRLQLHVSNWSDQVNRLTTRCQSEMQRGRYQRMSGDVLPLLEQTYRTIKHLWALLQAAPFCADYVPLTRTLRCLRVLVDVVSPTLQHFVMTCEALNTRRDILSKANSMIVNTSVNASTVLLTFHTFNRAGGERSWVIPDVPNQTYASLTDFISQYTDGTPLLLVDSLGRGKTIHSLIHQLSPPLADVDDCQIGKVILTLFEPLTDGTDFSDLLVETRERFGEMVLLEMVSQGLAIDALLSRKFLLAEEARKLGASEETLARTMAGLPVEEVVEAPAPREAPVAAAATPQAAAVPPELAPGMDPFVDMVAEVFPHFSRRGIRAALNYYNNDPEQFILDASMENIPPHLHTQLNADTEAMAAAVADVAPEVAANAAIANTTAVEAGEKPADKPAHLTAKDFEDEYGVADLQLYLGSDLYELVTGSDTDDDGGDSYDNVGGDSFQDFTTYRKDDDDNLFSANVGAFGQADDDMREKIRMLNELMYEDELDDGQHDEVRVANAGTDTDSEAEGSPSGAAARAGGGGAPQRQRRQAPQQGGGRTDAGRPEEAVPPVDQGGEGDGKPQGPPGQPRPPPRSDYDNKQFRARVARERSKRVKEAAAERAQNAPAYAKKQKTAKREKRGGGDKNSLTRAFKKGAL